LSRGFDPVSTNGKRLTPRESVQLLVVGAGPAGCTAALEAARLGLKTMLVDENPLDPASMGLEVPFHFGGRMTGAARNRNAMTEAIVANDAALGEAFEAGVDVRLGVAVWTLVAPASPGSGDARPASPTAPRPGSAVSTPPSSRRAGAT